MWKNQWFGAYFGKSPPQADFFRSFTFINAFSIEFCINFWFKSIIFNISERNFSTLKGKIPHTVTQILYPICGIPHTVCGIKNTATTQIIRNRPLRRHWAWPGRLKGVGSSSSETLKSSSFAVAHDDTKSSGTAPDLEITLQRLIWPPSMFVEVPFSPILIMGE